MLFLWATAPKLPEALETMKSWGFQYKTNAVWVKEDSNFGTAYYFRAQHELSITGEKGDMPIPKTKNRISSVVKAQRGRHSEKSELAYGIIQSMYPNIKYLELCARKRMEGSVSWGSEE